MMAKSQERGAAPPAQWGSLPRLAVLFALMQAVLLGLVLAVKLGAFAPQRQPTAPAYASFYAAGVLADQGHAPLAYDRAAHFAAEQALIAPNIDYVFFFNPPPFLLVMAPLARLPFAVSFLGFALGTLALWLALATRVAGGDARATACLLAVPALWWVLGLGQNAFLTGSILAGGTLLLRGGRPLAAGLVLGLLAIKPHYGLLLPVAFLAAGLWRAVLGAGLSVAGSCLASALFFGLDTWRAFFGMVLHSNEAIGGGEVRIGAHVDPRGALWHLGVAQDLGTLAGLVIALATAAAVFAVWRRRQDEIALAVLIAGTLLVVPFSLFYDLLLASLAACWLAAAARRSGGALSRAEQAVLVGCMVCSFLHPWLSVDLGLPLPLGALVAPALFGLAMRRHFAPVPERAASN